MQFKYKNIKQGGITFLKRLSLKTKSGSYKVHLILNDDQEGYHMHPWDFKSLLLFGSYKEYVEGVLFRHRPLSIVKRKANEKHRVELYRIGNFKLPCLTIGFYSNKIQPWCEKTQLCDFCKPHGQCQDKTYWEANTKNE